MSTGLIDSHAHLTSQALAGDLAGVLERAGRAGVTHVITIGTDAADSERAAASAASHESVFASVGIHPHEAGKVAAEDYARIEALAAAPKVVAIGEIGLDYHYDFAERNAQHSAFERQLALAAPLDLAVVIHCREAVQDTVQMLSRAGFDGRRVVFHCFTGTAAEAKLIADHGWRISFTGIVTYRRSSELQTIARQYPLDQLMVETDAPYLSPEPVRGVRPNEPAFVAHTARFIAELRGMPIGEITQCTFENTNRFFRLGL